MQLYPINSAHSIPFQMMKTKNGKTSLSNGCMWSSIRRRIGILGVGFKSGRAMLLDDVHSGEYSSLYLKTLDNKHSLCF